MTTLRDLLNKLAHDSIQAKEISTSKIGLEDNINGLVNEVIEIIRSRIIG